MSQVGANTLSIENCRSASECYGIAAGQCPYGFDVLNGGQSVRSATAQTYGNTTIATPVIRNELLAQCKPPIFCEDAACPYGFTCVKSQAYPGRDVCAAD